MIPVMEEEEEQEEQELPSFMRDVFSLEEKCVKKRSGKQWAKKP